MSAAVWTQARGLGVHAGIPSGPPLVLLTHLLHEAHPFWEKGSSGVWVELLFGVASQQPPPSPQWGWSPATQAVTLLGALFSLQQAGLLARGA